MNTKKEKTFEKREELIDAALKEFSEKGYEQASLNSILREAGISKGTFYYHFEHKEDLYLYLVHLLIEEKKQFFSKVMNQDFFAQDIFAQFQQLGELGIQFAEHKPSIKEFSESFLREKDNDIYRIALTRFNYKDNELFNQIIDQAYQKGDFREDLPRDFMKSIITYLFTNMHEITNAVKVDEFPQAFHYLVEFLKNGLAKKE